VRVTFHEIEIAAMDPLVALTTTLDPEGGDYRQPRIGLYANYLTPLQRVGLTPVLVTPAHSEAAIRSLVAACAGLVLSGGEDIDPARYGEEPIAQLGRLNTARDVAELIALDEAARRDLPVLGICRGHQLLNVFFGGSLYQDLEAQTRSGRSHRQSGPWGQPQHDAVIAPGSRLAEALGCERVRINSYHHQAVREVAADLQPVAVSEDGLVEAVESRRHHWILGVQWHPERHEAEAPDSDPNIRLYHAFAQAVRGGVS
jgi:putative glutamine amidotransferase